MWYGMNMRGWYNTDIAVDVCKLNKVRSADIIHTNVLRKVMQHEHEGLVWYEQGCGSTHEWNMVRFADVFTQMYSKKLFSMNMRGWYGTNRAVDVCKLKKVRLADMFAQMCSRRWYA